MRKVFLMIMCMAMVSAACGCAGARKCDVCDRKKAEHTLKLIDTWHLCDDCYYYVMYDL